MTLTLQYNWPMGKNAVTAGLGAPNVADRDLEFRMGIIKQDNKKMVGWVNPGWVDAEAVGDLRTMLKVGDLIIVERRQKKDGEIVHGHLMWNTLEKMPNDVREDSVTIVPWTF